MFMGGSRYAGRVWKKLYSRKLKMIGDMEELAE
jgi:hypothetical protein